VIDIGVSADDPMETQDFHRSFVVLGRDEGVIHVPSGPPLPPMLLSLAPDAVEPCPDAVEQGESLRNDESLQEDPGTDR
jgi:hypothetical protein